MNDNVNELNGEVNSVVEEKCLPGDSAGKENSDIERIEQLIYLGYI